MLKRVELTPTAETAGGRQIFGFRATVSDFSLVRRGLVHCRDAMKGNHALFLPEEIDEVDALAARFGDTPDQSPETIRTVELDESQIDGVRRSLARAGQDLTAGRHAGNLLLAVGIAPLQEGIAQELALHRRGLVSA